MLKWLTVMAWAAWLPFCSTGLAGGTSVEPRYRWTGAAGDSRWSSAGNWEVATADGWESAGTVPTRDSGIILGDAAPDTRQNIDINYHVEVARVTFSGTGNRVYRVRSWADPNDTGIDSDSGMLYSLRLTDPVPIIQTPESASGLIFEVEVGLAHSGGSTFRLLSRQGATVAVDGGLRVSGALQLDHGVQGTGRLMRRGQPYIINN